jgi:DNA polymerase-3 subunit gamma/tau
LKAQVNKPEEAANGEVIEETLGRQEAYKIEDLDKVWESFKRDREKEDNQLELLILKEPYKLNENIVTVSISNGASEASFERFRGDLLIAIRDGLKNDSIQLKSETIEIEREKMLYTDQEKFEHLKKKYPALKDLQERLGLDPEF